MTQRRRFPKWIFTVFLFTATVVYFVFNGRWSFLRVVQSIRDLAFSIAKYFVVVFGFTGNGIPNTISEIPDVPFVPLLPVESSNLEGFWGRFFANLFNGDRFMVYNYHVLQIVLNVQRFLLPVLLLFLLLKIWLSDSADVENDDFVSAFLKPAARHIERLLRTNRPETAYGMTIDIDLTLTPLFHIKEGVAHFAKVEITAIIARALEEGFRPGRL